MRNIKPESYLFSRIAPVVVSILANFLINPLSEYTLLLIPLTIISIAAISIINKTPIYLYGGLLITILFFAPLNFTWTSMYLDTRKFIVAAFAILLLIHTSAILVINILFDIRVIRDRFNKQTGLL